jgi:hypothetical protein
MSKPIRAITVIRTVEISDNFKRNHFGNEAVDSTDSPTLPEQTDPLVASMYAAFNTARRLAPRRRDSLQILISGILE